MGLKVKLLDSQAKAPTVAHPMEDIGYDLYACEDAILRPMTLTKVRCGVAVEATDHDGRPCGLLIRDRSSMAAKGIFTHGGVIDAGYRGEMLVMLTALKPKDVEWVDAIYDDVRVEIPYWIKSGDKIAQMVPVPVLTGTVEVVGELTSAARGEKGFGSSGAS